MTDAQAEACLKGSLLYEGDARLKLQRRYVDGDWVSQWAKLDRNQLGYQDSATWFGLVKVNVGRYGRAAELPLIGGKVQVA